MKHILSSILLSLFLTACGGGSSVPTSVESNIPATLYDTSYKNFKLNGTDSLRYPNYQLRWKWGNPAVGFGDFLKAGELGVFVAYTNYEPSTPLSQIQADPSNYASEYIFYTVNQDKSLTKSISMKGCLNPRKAVVADFNKDGIADLVPLILIMMAIPILLSLTALILFFTSTNKMVLSSLIIAEQQT